jgi:L-aminopeptidase/D-esterase-like protein
MPLGIYYILTRAKYWQEPGDQESFQFANSAKWVKQGITRRQFGAVGSSDPSTFNTTLGIIATNASLSKKEVHQVAQIAHSGLAKSDIAPSSTFDGDLLLPSPMEKESGCEHRRAPW